MTASGNFGGGMRGGPNAGGNAGPMGGSASGGFGGGRDRPGRGPYTGTTTPKYGWDQARMSDFGIMGALMNAVSGVMAGDTYAGRTPQGFSQSSQRDMGAFGPGSVGNTGHGNPGMMMGDPAGGGIGYGMMQKMLQRQAAARQAQPPVQAATAQAPWLQKVNVPQMFLSTGGQYGYGTFRPGYNFFGNPQSRAVPGPATEYPVKTAGVR